MITSKPLEDIENVNVLFGKNIFPETKENFDAEIRSKFVNSFVSEHGAQEFAHELRIKNPNAQIYMTYDHNQHIGNIRSNIPLDQLDFFPYTSYKLQNKLYGIKQDGRIAYNINHVDNINVEKFDGRYYYVRRYSKFFGNSSFSNQNTITGENQNTNVTPERVAAVAQNESARRLRIAHINRSINGHRSLKRMFAVLTGISIAGIVAATELSGITNELGHLKPEDLLNSFDAIKEALSKFTPAMWGSFGAYILNGFAAARESAAQNRATNELYDTENYVPEAFTEEAERQLRTR